MPKISANGVAHTWVNNYAYENNGAAFVAELSSGTLTAAGKDAGTYGTMSQTVRIGLIERGVSMYEQFAVQQSGMSYDFLGQSALDSLAVELQDGTLSMAHLWQKCLYQGTTTGSKTGTDEYGNTYTSGFNGLRYILGVPGASDTAYYPTGATNNDDGNLANYVDIGTGTMLSAINHANTLISNKGGKASALHCSYFFAEKLAQELQAFYRKDNADGQSTYGMAVSNIILADGRMIPVVVVPGDSIGTYTYNSATVEDAYLLQENEAAFACLGPKTPGILEIPVGADGTLGRRYLIWFMATLALRNPQHHAKIRLTH